MVDRKSHILLVSLLVCDTFIHSFIGLSLFYKFVDVVSSRFKSVHRYNGSHTLSLTMNFIFPSFIALNMDFLFSQCIKSKPVALGLVDYFSPFLNIIRKNILKTEIWLL